MHQRADEVAAVHGRNAFCILDVGIGVRQKDFFIVEIAETIPDGALWTFLAGLGLLVGPWTAWAPTAWTLLLNSGLGFCVQGIAVVESLLLARGVPPSVIALTMVFVFTVAWPVFMLATGAVGLSDVWLDYRRLERVPGGDPS